MTYRRDPDGTRVFLVSTRFLSGILIVGHGFRLGTRIYERYVVSVRIGRRWHGTGR